MKLKSAYFLIAAALVSLTSCLDQDDYYLWGDIYPNAIVTVKTADDGRMFLQLDEETTLLPDNMTASPFGDKEVRALTNFKSLAGEKEGYDEIVYVNWIDSILTKNPVPFVAGENDKLYGSAPVDIVDDWITIVEDGYLTLHLRMEWGDQNKQHRINLLTGGNPDDPYQVELRHDAMGDGNGMAYDTYAAFCLDSLPDTKGETVKLKLVWESLRGSRSAEFDYCTREEKE
jgi:hypothetical protein